MKKNSKAVFKVQYDKTNNHSEPYTAILTNKNVKDSLLKLIIINYKSNF